MHPLKIYSKKPFCGCDILSNENKQTFTDYPQKRINNFVTTGSYKMGTVLKLCYCRANSVN